MRIVIDVIVSKECTGIMQETGHQGFVLQDVKTEGVISGTVDVADGLYGEALERAIEQQEEPVIKFLEDDGWTIDNIYRNMQQNEQGGVA